MGRDREEIPGLERHVLADLRPQRAVHVVAHRVQIPRLEEVKEARDGLIAAALVFLGRLDHGKFRLAGIARFLELE